MQVQLDAYSGRPNPTWTLSASEGQDLIKKLRTLRQPGGPGMPPPDLGYRGFVLHHDQEQWRVYEGHIEWSDGMRSEVFQDTQGIEAHLKSQARKRGYGTAVP